MDKVTKKELKKVKDIILAVDKTVNDRIDKLIYAYGININFVLVLIGIVAVIAILSLFNPHFVEVEVDGFVDYDFNRDFFSYNIIEMVEDVDDCVCDDCIKKQDVGNFKAISLKDDCFVGLCKCFESVAESKLVWGID